MCARAHADRRAPAAHWHVRRRTPLHVAAASGRAAVVAQLLARGADVHAKDIRGCARATAHLRARVSITVP
jgi:hypothetical protein